MVLPILLALALSWGLATATMLGLFRLIGSGGHGERWLDRPGSEPHKELKNAVPNVGGVAVFLGVAVPMAAALLIGGSGVLQPALDGGSQIGAAASDLLAGLQGTAGRGWGLLAAMLLLHATGLLDDRRPLGALPKLALQVAAALLVVGLVGSRALTVAGAVPSVVLTVLWIVAIINAMNFLDNMDGLSAGVAAIVAGVYLLSAAAAGQWLVAGLAALLLGALLGFLWFNLPPARVYLGDGGSLLVGLLLAVLALEMTYHVAPAGGGAASVSALGDAAPAALTPGTQWHAVLMPLVVFSVPLYDMVSVTVIRLRDGRSPLRGDRNHFSHRLVKLGLSRLAAVAVIWLATLATACGGVVVGRADGRQAVLAAVQAAAVLATLAVLEVSGRRVRR